MIMNERELEKRLKLIDKEIDFQVNEIANTKRILLSEIDKMKIELEVLKRFIGELHQEFENSYLRIKESVIHEVNPESI